MRRKRFFWHLYPPYLIIIFLSLLVLIFYATSSFRNLQAKRIEKELESRAYLFEESVLNLLHIGDVEAIDELCKETGRKSGTRLTVILPSGTVLGDSDKGPDTMDNHASRPEVITAIGGHVGSSIRLSATVKKNMMYVAVPAFRESQLLAVVRASLPIANVRSALGDTFTGILIVGVTIIILAAAISLYLSRRFSTPVEELTRGAERFAGGDLKRKLIVPGTEELGKLADAMNTMAEQLDERISTITHQRNEQEAILSCMTEGVLAVNSDEHIIMMNEAAATMLEVDRDAANGRWIQEAVRNSDIQEFVKQTLELTPKDTVESEVLLDSTTNGSSYMQMHGTVLNDPQQRTIGALIVFNDITKLKHLETIRRDFVANVSHELRTPLTSIQGFVETLLQGAMNSKEERERFLNIIATHVNRLNSIIEDLLILSKIEKEAERESIDAVQTALSPVLKEAIEVCGGKAREKNIEVCLKCDPKLIVSINSFLFEQAVINLIDNAVKYGKEDSEVLIEVNEENGRTNIKVHDQGAGIDSKHLPRLFERFYRIDKARSSKLGGTGLGLSIVKHIMLAHNGTVSVETRLGVGSTFILSLPA
ncbi:MAG: HAMP domain-containing protein [Chitinivibrionales bacterium]|nr:HAMP domain-containing protein [Chitinivibrionales bacterium]